MAHRRLVVARYYEDASWVRMYPEIEHTIYDKYDGKRPMDITSEFDRDGLNIVHIRVNPRPYESHTYLWHIINEYDNLDDYTVFVQGNPFPHTMDFAKEIMAEAPFAWIGSWVTECMGDGRPHQGGMPVAEFYQDLFEEQPPEIFYFTAGAQFVASRERIRDHPKEWYERLMNMLTRGKYQNDLGCMERMWGYILGSYRHV